MDTKDQILDIAQKLIQERGVNGFSYADIAKELGIAKASLHHHFATKTALVSRLLTCYTQSLIEHLEEVSRTHSGALAQLQAYQELYAGSVEAGRACVGGMLSAEAITLDASLMPQLRRFFDFQQQWLTGVLEQGLEQGELAFTGTAQDQACGIIACLQGALVVSKSQADPRFYQAAVKGLMSQLSHLSAA